MIMVRGIIHGKLIELESSLNIPDGESVEILTRLRLRPTRYSVLS